MSTQRPVSISEIPSSVCRGLTHVFTDLDDTVTDDGLLPADSYRALWDLKNDGIAIVIVTGRPAGWCDFFARMWPVDGVVGENGAFFFVYDRDKRRMKRRYLLSDEERAEGRRRLEVVRRRVLAEVPGSAIAADQPYRITDLAIDFCEDVEPLPRDQVRRIAAIAQEEGAVSKISSIHVNCWYGDFDKIACVRLFLREQTGIEWEEANPRSVFMGDSPNDEPMFHTMAHSIGVANLNDFLDDMTFLPTYMTSRRSGAGFQEAVKIILDRRL